MLPQLSITTGSFFPEQTIHAINRIRRLGFSSFELTIQESDVSYGFARTFDTGFFRRILQLTRELNIRASTVHAPYFSAVQVFSEKVRAEIMEKALEGASLLQSELLITHPYHIFSSYENAVSFFDGKLSLEKSLLSGFRRLLQKAEAENVTLAIENVAHWNDSSLLNNPRNMLALVEELNSERIKVDVDLFHSEIGKCTDRFLRELNHLIVSFHVSDISVRESRTLPCKGKLDWEKMCVRLEKVRHLRHVVLETAGRSEDGEVSQSVDFLKRLLLSTI